MKRKIGIFVGSLRKASNSKSIADCIMKLAPADFDMQIIEMGNLPIYNQDFDDENIQIEAYSKFRETVESLDAVLFIMPEHNRSIPAVLKNALDVASMPYGCNKWAKKPAAIISQSQGALGGFGANHHLRQVLVVLGVPTMAHPECYLGQIKKNMDEQGVITSESMIQFLQSFVNAYVDWVNLILK